MPLVTDIIPGLPPLSIITVVGMCIIACTLVLYMLSRMPELLLITIIACVYAATPVLPMLKHL